MNVQTNTKLLTIHSYAVHGTASLKVMQSLLGTRVLPVPSLYLTGLTNLSGIQKFSLHFEEALAGSLALAAQREERLMLYIGYLGEAAQAETILRALHAHRAMIQQVIVDPVSGDHGRRYVPEPVLDAWPDLLSEADWAFPNFTELKLLSGLPLEGPTPDAYLQAFHERFPRTQFLVTSFPVEDQLAVHWQGIAEQERYLHSRLPRHYGGTGDVFAAHFVHAHWYQQQSPSQAMRFAADATLGVIQKAIDADEADLQISGALR